MPHSPSSVIGSFQSLRIERGSTSISSSRRVGSRPWRCWKTRIASAYCQPRKISSSSLVTTYGLQYNMKSVLGYPEKQATVVTGGNVGGTFNLDKAGAKVTVVNAVHGSELVPPMYKHEPGEASALASGNPVGYVIQIDNGPTLYHTGDTDVFTDMQLIARFFEVDVMFAAIGGHFTMDPPRAAQAVEWVNPKQVVPIHFGTFPLLAGTPAQLKAALDARGLGDRMVEMKPGETRDF
jgi:L-ascorbate metabolism protein UlaG (beta-lactamase superfamily)